MADHESPARTARRVMRGSGLATLATTLAGDGADWPYASLVLVALDTGLAPLLLISELAEHTKNLRRTPRASLLFDATAGLADPLTGARVTVLGAAAPLDDQSLRERFVRRHPAAAAYTDFHDFKLWRLVPTRAHLVAGFGRIHWLDAGALVPPAAAAAALAEAEPGILAHMNEDHRATIDLYAQRLLGRSGEGWRVTGVDSDGADLRLDAAAARLEFAAPVADAEAVRREFIRLAREARGETPAS
jgi:heme iron utilization protein